MVFKNDGTWQLQCASGGVNACLKREFLSWKLLSYIHDKGDEPSYGTTVRCRSSQCYCMTECHRLMTLAVSCWNSSLKIELVLRMLASNQNSSNREEMLAQLIQ